MDIERVLGRRLQTLLPLGFCAGAVMIGLVGCSAKKRFDDVSTTYLQDVDVNKRMDNMPFDHSWVYNQINRDNYYGIYVPPIKTETLPKDHWTNSMSAIITSEADYLAEARDIAVYFRQRLIEEINKDPQKHFRAVDRPGPGVAVLQLALTELEFSHPVARAGTLAVPVPGTGAALSAITDPHAAFAARLTDGATGKLIATAADRKFPPTRVIDLNKFTVTSSAREVCSIWAEELAEAIHKGRLGEVAERGRFDWKPW